MLKRFAVVFIIFASVLHASHPGTPTAWAENTQALMHQAIRLSLKGDLKEAQKILQEILKKEPNNMFAHSNLGKIYFDQKEFDLALASYRKALDINPNFSMAQNNIAMVYMETGNYEKAEAIFKKALEHTPDFELANGNLGEIYLLQKHYDKAVTYLQKAADTVPWVARYHFLLAKAFEGKNMDAEARKELELYKQLKKNK